MEFDPVAPELRRDVCRVDHRTTVAVGTVHVLGNGVEARPRKVVKSVALVERGLVIGLSLSVRTELALDLDGTGLLGEGESVGTKLRDEVLERAEHDVRRTVVVEQDVRIARLRPVFSLRDERLAERVAPGACRGLGRHDADLRRPSREVVAPTVGERHAERGPARLERTPQERILWLQHAFEFPFKQVRRRPHPPVAKVVALALQREVMPREQVHAPLPLDHVRVAHGTPDQRADGIPDNGFRAVRIARGNRHRRRAD